MPRPEADVELCASSASSLSSFACAVSSRAKSGGTLHLADDRIKCAVGVLRRAEIAQAGVRLGCEAFQQRCGQSRLADARFTGEQHHLAFAGLRFRPAPQQEFEFFFPSDKLGQAARVESLEAAFDRSSVAVPPRLALALRCP